MYPPKDNKQGWGSYVWKVTQLHTDLIFTDRQYWCRESKVVTFSRALVTKIPPRYPKKDSIQPKIPVIVLGSRYPKRFFWAINQ